jgi:Calcineurin-like phosphoesterase
VPTPERLLPTLRRAVQAFHDTPGRRGHFVPLPDAAEVLVAGDLHGNIENFSLLLRRADLGQHPQRHLVLQEVIHGPFQHPDGTDKSHQLVDLVAALKCQYPRQFHFLLGNHELSQWTDRRIAKGDRHLNDAFRAGVNTAYGSRGPEVYAAYLDLFAAAPLALRTANRVFLSHSLPAPTRLEVFDLAVLERDEFLEDDLKLGGPVHSLLWGRDTAAATAAAFLAKVDADLLITGHIPCEEGFAVPNDRQLILDSLGAPACFCLFPTDRVLSHQELLQHVGTV